MLGCFYWHPFVETHHAQLKCDCEPSRRCVGALVAEDCTFMFSPHRMMRYWQEGVADAEATGEGMKGGKGSE